MTVITMATTPCKCKGKEGKMCNHCAPSLAKDSQVICVACRGQNCSVDLRFDYAFWSMDKWSCIQAYIDDLECERKIERKLKFSSFTFTGFDLMTDITKFSSFTFTGFDLMTDITKLCGNFKSSNKVGGPLVGN